MALLVGAAGLLAAGGLTVAAQQSAARPAPHLALLDGYCFSCHDDVRKEAGLSLEPAGWERDERPRFWLHEGPWVIEAEWRAVDRLHLSITVHPGAARPHIPERCGDIAITCQWK